MKTELRTFNKSSIKNEKTEKRLWKKEITKDAIYGDGMCPYIPCRNFPKCNHIKEQMEFNKQW